DLLAGSYHGGDVVQRHVTAGGRVVQLPIRVPLNDTGHRQSSVTPASGVGKVGGRASDIDRFDAVASENRALAERPRRAFRVRPRARGTPRASAGATHGATSPKAGRP